MMTLRKTITIVRNASTGVVAAALVLSGCGRGSDAGAVAGGEQVAGLDAFRPHDAPSRGMRGGRGPSGNRNDDDHQESCGRGGGGPGSERTGGSNGGGGRSGEVGGAQQGGRGGAGVAGRSGDSGGEGSLTPPPLSDCPVFAPTTPAITGSNLTIAAPFALYTYAAPGLSPPLATAIYGTDGVWQALDVVISPTTALDMTNSWIGFGVPVFGCVDARAYRGVRFSIAGDLGTCALSFGVVARNNNSVLYGGACTASVCVGPSSRPLLVGASSIDFGDLTDGRPNAALDPSQINDLDWRVVLPSDGVTAPCAARFTISDIAFVPR